MFGGMTRIAYVLWMTAILSAHGNSQAASTSDSEAHCTEITHLDFAQLQDAPTEILDASWVQSGKEPAGYCQVSGYVSPTRRPRGEDPEGRSAGGSRTGTSYNVSARFFDRRVLSTLYPYPTETRYSGHGDPHNASSFVAEVR